MECRRTAIAGGVLRSPPSASAAPLTVAANAGVMRHRGLRHSRLYDCDDQVVDEYNNNKNNSNSNAYATTINNTTQLVDELEQLRTDNFQLRLRVYNAERRVDRLSAAALGRDREKRSDTDTDGDDTTDGGSSGHGDTDRCNNAAAKATAEAAVRTIHDLLTVNRRLLALLAATVSAKAVSVSADDKRRWRRLRKHIDKYSADGTKEEKTNELDEDDDEFHDVSATDSETSCKSRAVSAERSATRQNVLRSPPPPPAPSSSAAPPETTGEDDEGAGSEVSRLRGRCRRLERSLQQLVNTELWARNRQIGKLEQQKYVTQAAAQRDRKPTEAVPADAAAPLQQHYLQQFRSKAASTAPMPAATKGILVKRLPAETPTATASTAATASQNHRQSPTAVTTITTPPPVLPDYSEVNFFFSCDEEDDDDDEDSSAEMNTSSSEEQTANSDDRGGDQEPVRLTAIAAPPASSASARKRHCRPHHRQLQQPIKSVGDTATVTTTSSSSAESAAADEAGDLNGDGAVATTAATRGRTVSGGGGGGGGLHRRRRCRPPRRCSTCGRCSGVVDAEPAADHSRPPSVTDAQVQCGDGNVATDRGSSSGSDVGEPQLQLLRRELDARRRENGRLYDMLLRLQRETQSGDRGKGDGGPRNPSPDLSDSDLSGSPEPHPRAAGAVRGRIDDLLPPLLSVRSISDDDDNDDNDNGGGGEGHQRDQPDGAEQQQQQQLMLLTRLRERIVAYERRELNGGDDRAAGAVQSAQPRPEDTSNDAVRRMDRTDLVNVALPRVVERLRQALVPLLQHRQENAVAAPAGGRSSNVGDGDAFVDGARPSPPSEER